MKIAFNPMVLSENLFKGSCLPSFSAEQKRVALIVSAIFVGLLSLYYVIKKFCFSAKPKPEIPWAKVLPFNFKDKPEPAKEPKPKKVLPEFDVDVKDAPQDLIDKLSPQLKELHGITCGSSSSTGKVTRTRRIKLDDLDVSIVIVMTRKEISPKDAVCGGTIFSNTAVVEITPENDQVLKAVAAYFKSQFHPKNGGKSHDMPLFSEVEINGKSLKMYPKISLDDVEKIEVSGICMKTNPCQHHTTVFLKDGRKASGLSNSDICSIVSHIAKERINPGLPENSAVALIWPADSVIAHFRGYSKPRKRAEAVLNKMLFRKS